ncbi:MAG: ATP-binding protein [Methylacidiphilales bacterium]|nr:ATP-binding protein [Candidatus Methylacidiphilales bacterium]
MKRPRSIRARLITLYVVTLSLIFVCFGGYTYWGFKQYLLRSLQQTLTRRAHQIASTILAEMPQKGESYVSSEIQARYAPELNERIIRISDQSGRIIYASQNAGVLSKPPSVSFVGTNMETKPVHREEMPQGEERLQVVAIGYRLSNGAPYIVEVGTSENDVFSALDGLLLTLLLGFPVFIGLTSVGAYVLLGRALRPVDQIVRSAERITLQNLSQRLPIPDTGDEVERLSLALNRMIQRLDEAFQLTTRFTADASHELRTPLTIMRGELEALLQEERLSEDQSSQIESVLEEAERLTQIIEGLLLMSRLEAGESQMSKDPINFADLVSTTVEQMTPLAEDKSVALVCEAARDVTVEANEVRLKQVVVNLLDNAIKYTPEGGKITVRVLGEPSWAILEVSDNGIGISEEALPHVFERFYRSEQIQARKARGTGLGLSMVLSIVEAHAGKVEVESRENEGATFRVRLPRFELRMGARRR